MINRVQTRVIKLQRAWSYTEFLHERMHTESLASISVNSIAVREQFHGIEDEPRCSVFASPFWFVKPLSKCKITTEFRTITFSENDIYHYILAL